MTEQILTWVTRILETTPTRWVELCTTTPVELLMRPPKEGEWSAIECLQHLVDTERMVFPARVEHLLARRDFPAFDPDSQGENPDLSRTSSELAEVFANLRKESLGILAKVKLEDLGHTALHAELGLVTLSELLHEWAAHDLMHTVQAERALMQPFILGSGPWHVYFKDHVQK